MGIDLDDATLRELVVNYRSQNAAMLDAKEALCQYIVDQGWIGKWDDLTTDGSVKKKVAWEAISSIMSNTQSGFWGSIYGNKK